MRAQLYPAGRAGARPRGLSYLAGKAAEFSVYLVFGLPVKEKVESILFNAAVVIGPDGELLGDYRKLHLRGEERLAFRPGYRLPLFETEFGQLGVMIGWDVAFPEVARSLTLDGVELIVARAVWEADHMEEWRAYTVARGGENQVFVAARLICRRRADLQLWRRVDADRPARGTVHTALDEAIEGYAVADRWIWNATSARRVRSRRSSSAASPRRIAGWYGSIRDLSGVAEASRSAARLIGIPGRRSPTWHRVLAPTRPRRHPHRRR